MAGSKVSWLAVFVMGPIVFVGAILIVRGLKPEPILREPPPAPRPVKRANLDADRADALGGEVVDWFNSEVAHGRRPSDGPAPIGWQWGRNEWRWTARVREMAFYRQAPPGAMGRVFQRLASVSEVCRAGSAQQFDVWLKATGEGLIYQALEDDANYKARLEDEAAQAQDRAERARHGFK